MGAESVEYLILWSITMMVVIGSIMIDPYAHWKRDLFNMLFRPKFYSGNLYLEKRRIEEKIQDNAHKKFQHFMHDIDNGQRGLVMRDMPRIELLEMPIIGLGQMSMSTQTVYTTRKDVEQLMVSISHDSVSMERVKQHAAFELSKKIVDMGFLKGDVDTSRNRVMFYINYFK